MLHSHTYEAKPVWLAPMSGSTDAAFRRQAVLFGAPAVVSEMVAGETLAKARPDVVRRTCRHDGEGHWIVQLAARAPEHMKIGAELLREAGVDVIDINMGCPARQVTGGNSGSALMREPELALRIIDAALEGAAGKPVTLKMRLGWDDGMLNAPEIALEAVKRGIRMITVHGRTRCQFYKGKADWKAIRRTVEAITVPVIANGDIGSVEDAKEAMRLSGSHGVMIGRAAMGQPWLPGLISAKLEGRPFETPTLAAQCESLCEQISDSMALYGDRLGLRTVRKHVAACIDKVALPLNELERRRLRSELCRIDDPDLLFERIHSLYLNHEAEIAA